jgi:cation transport ATPase
MPVCTTQEVGASRTATQESLDQFAAWYTPLILLVAVLTALVPPLVHLAQGGPLVG